MEQTVVQLTRQAQAKYYGKYRGIAADNEDPQQRARLKVKVPSVLGEEITGWALPCLPFGGTADQGTVFVPEVGAQVWVEFEEGDLQHPIWTGTFYAAGDMPAEAAKNPPTTRLVKTPSGHLLQFDDEAGSEAFALRHPAGAEVTIDKDGTVLVKDAQGSTISLDAASSELRVEDANGNAVAMTSSGLALSDLNGNEIAMAAGGITIKGQIVTIDAQQVELGGAGGEPVIKGQSFISMFMTHTHPTVIGPTAPPIPQGEMTTLSIKTKSS